MKRFLCVVLSLSVISPFSAISQPIDLSSPSLRMLTSQLKVSKALWLKASGQVLILQQNLKEAVESQIASVQKIKDLETSLTEAQKQQKHWEKTSRDLEKQLTKLSGQVKSLSEEIVSAEVQHVKDIATLTKRYDLRLAIYRTVLITLVILAVAEGIYIGARQLQP